MGLAESRWRVEEERVVGLTRELGDGERRGVGQPIPLADDELLEPVARVEAVGVPNRRRAGLGYARGRCAAEHDADGGPEDLFCAPLHERSEPPGQPAL